MKANSVSAMTMVQMAETTLAVVALPTASAPPCALRPLLQAMSVTIQPNAVSVAKDATTNLTAVCVPSTAEVTWSSSAEGKATVDENGTVTGVATGSATITATITVNGHDYTDTCAVTVTAAA